MRLAARAGAALAATAFVALSAPPASPAPGRLELPKPLGEIPVPAEAFPDRPERLRRSLTPGSVDDTERIEVQLAPDGTPAAVSVTQRLVLGGTGQFIIWERASALDAEALDDTIAPVLKREAVIWQGFVDGSKTLSAKLTLDPRVEVSLLPFAVTVEWLGPGELGPGGAVPGEGEVAVTIRNVTARSMDLPTGDVAPDLLADPLDTLLSAANSRTPAAPPAAGRGLPAALDARDLGPTRNVSVPAPLRITGTILMPGSLPASDVSQAVVPVPDGIEVDGVLQGDVRFVLRSRTASTLSIDLTAFPTVDPRGLEPPSSLTWRAWAAQDPDPTRAATDALVLGAAEAARAHEYAPYLGHHGQGKVSTSFHLSMAPADVVRATPTPLRPKAFPITLAGVALLGVVANGTALWRRL
jgi:hypothetical protein